MSDFSITNSKRTPGPGRNTRRAADNERFAIMAVDGGGKTGVAKGVFKRHTTLAETLKDRSSFETTTITGDTSAQIRQLAMLFNKFRNEVARKGLEAELVIEDFILRPGAHGGGEDGILSCRVGWGLWGWFMGEQSLNHVVWQAPAEALGSNREQLQNWGLWIVGRDHERDACRHIAARINTLMQQVHK